MKRACDRAGVHLQQRAAGLSTAAGLELEEHLHGCDDCRRAANLLDGLRELYTTDQPLLGTTQREQAIARALDARSAASTVVEARRSRRFVPNVRAGLWIAAPALAALMTLVVVRAIRTDHDGSASLPGNATREGESARSAPAADATRDPTVARGERVDEADRADGDHVGVDVPAGAGPNANSVATHRAPGGDRVLAGRVERDGSELGPGLQLNASDELASSSGATLALGHATAQLRAASRVRWHADREQLELLSGSVEVRVDRAPHRRFSVTTARFSAVVLGTIFEVSPTTVRVREGRVQIVDRSGRKLAVLDAKKHRQFTLDDHSPEPASDSDPAALLDLAREQIGGHQLPAARRSLARALSLPISQEQRAEARSLQAECALVAGEFAAARDSYLGVVNEFPNLPAGQTALFAAARIEAQHGQPERATDLFQRYLDRYPQGQFAREAAARLKPVSKATRTK